MHHRWPGRCAPEDYRFLSDLIPFIHHQAVEDEDLTRNAANTSEFSNPAAASLENPPPPRLPFGPLPGLWRLDGEGLPLLDVALGLLHVSRLNDYSWIACRLEVGTSLGRRHN